MRVAIFFDGKNFHAGWRSQASSVRVDFPALTRWLVDTIQGDHLWGAYYYTGVERGERAEDDGQRKLTAFLNMLELQPGFFVKRFPRKISTWSCESCGHESRHSHEKEVDTTLVADMLSLAATGAADVLILISGDADHAPAVEGVRRLGRQVYVASWGGVGMSSRLRRAAFDHIDLLDGLSAFTSDETNGLAPEDDDDDDYAPSPGPSLIAGEVGDVHAQIAEELRRAEDWFEGGYVGLNYFLTRWKSPILDPSPEVRRKLLHQLADQGQVEIYEVDGALAVRSNEVGLD